MYETKFGANTQQQISKILSKRITRVLAFFMFYETRQKNVKISQSIELCHLYNYKQLCLYWLFRLLLKKLSELCIGSGGRLKHVNKNYDKILGIGISDLLMNLMSCHCFLNNKDSVVILKFPKRMFEYYFSKGFIHFYWNNINLEKIQSEVKDRIYSEVTDNPEKFMICSTTIPSNSNTMKHLLVNASFHSSYIQK